MTGLRVGLDLTPLLGPPAGIHQVTRGLLDALVERRDVDVTGWLLSSRGRRPSVEVPVRRSRIPASVVRRTWARGRLPPGRLVTGAVDVAHGTNFVAPPNRRSIISVQDLSPILHPGWCRPEVVAMAGPLRNAVRRGASIHVSSRAVADEAIEVLGIDPARLHVVHHAVTPVGAADPELGRRLAGADRYVLVLGTVETRKNVGAVLRAMAEIAPETTVVVAGAPGNDETVITQHRAPLTRLATLDATGRDALLRGAAVLAYPSRYEGFGLPPLEAVSVGTPVVASAVGALPELIGDRVNLVPAGDDDAFSEALRAALESPPPPDDALQARVAAMTWDRAAATMVTAYRAVAGQIEGDPAAR